MNNELPFCAAKGQQIKPRCRKCNELLDRIPRTPAMKIFFFWLPIRNYYCYRCKNNKVIFKRKKDKQVSKYLNISFVSSRGNTVDKQDLQKAKTAYTLKFWNLKEHGLPHHE